MVWIGDKAEKRFTPKKQAEGYLQTYRRIIGMASDTKKRRTAPEAKKPPMISVVTPSLNQAKYLEACIRSVIEQDYPNIEYIIMDGGSSDGSQDIIAKYSNRIAYWQSRPDGGHYAAVEAGLRRCRGEILTWLNADDYFHPQAFRQIAAIFMQRPEVKWITGRPSSFQEKEGYLFVLPHLPIWSRKRYLEGHYHHPFIQQEGTFWRRSLWEKAGAGMCGDFRLAGDMELWTRFFRYAPLFSVDIPVAAYRAHGENRALLFMENYLAEAEQIIAEERKRKSDGVMIPAPVPITRNNVSQYIKACGKVFDKHIIGPSTGKTEQCSTDSSNLFMVSAIVSTYNSERFMQGCMEDLLAQTISDRIEIIVIDSASLENEAGIVKDYQHRLANIKYIRTNIRESVYQAWNRGIKAARGKYITNANTDDRHRPDAFERMVAVMEKEPHVALVYADVIKTEKANQTFRHCTPSGALHWPQWNRALLLDKGCFIGPQPMWRRSVHKFFGNFDETYAVSSDYEFWLRISQVFDFKKLTMPLGLYHERADSVEHIDFERKKIEDQSIHALYNRANRQKRIIGFKPYEKLQKAFSLKSREKAMEALTEIEQAARRKSEAIKGQIVKACQAMRALTERDPQIAQDQLEAFASHVNASFLSRSPVGDLCQDWPINDAPRQTMPPSNTMKKQANQSLRGERPMDVTKKIRQGIHLLLNNGQQEAALWVLEKLLADFPDDAAAHHDKAQLAHANGDMESAGLHFQRAAALEEGNAGFQKSLADFYHVVHKDKDAAIRQYLKVVHLMPEDTASLLILSHLYVSLQRFDEARRYYGKILAIEPGHVQAKQCLEKIEAFAEQDRVDFSSDLLGTARQYATNGNRDQAIQMVRQILAREPDNAMAHNDLGALLYEAGDMEQCLACYERAAQLAPEEAVYQKNLADFYACEKGLYERAMEKYVQVLTLDPQDIEALWATAQICLKYGKKEDALVFLNRILEIEPWHQKARALLEELQSAATSWRISCDNPNLHDEAKEKINNGDIRGAAEALKQAIVQDPDDAMAYNDLGVVQYDLDEKAEALRCYEQAVRLDGSNPVFLKNLADFYYIEQGRTQEALNLYVRMLEKDNEDIDCLIAAGTICAHLDKREDARVFFERVLEIEPWNQQGANALRELGREGELPFAEDARRAAVR